MLNQVMRGHDMRHFHSFILSIRGAVPITRMEYFAWTSWQFITTRAKICDPNGAYRPQNKNVGWLVIHFHFLTRGIRPT